MPKNNEIMITHDRLIQKVVEWFIERNLQDAAPEKQMLKLIEEVGELASGIARQNYDEIVDAIGDVQVVLVGLSLQLDLDLTQCLETAYREIKERKGKLINGIFVKETDLTIAD